MCLVGASNSDRNQHSYKSYCVQFTYFQVTEHVYHHNCYTEWYDEITHDLTFSEKDEIYSYNYHEHLSLSEVFQIIASNPLNCLEICHCCETPIYKISEIVDEQNITTAPHF